MSTVRHVVVGAGGATAAAACVSWGATLMERGVHTVDELVAVTAAGVAAGLAAWYTLTALALLLAEVVSRSTRCLPVAGALCRAAGAWGAPLLRRAAAAGAGAGLVLGMSPAWATTGDSPPSPAAPTVGGVPLDLRPGFVEPVATAQTAAAYVVRPGDSLWSISAAALGPGATDAQIAAEWPRWYRTNHAVVGADPHLIHPGQILLAPEPKDAP